MNAATSRGLPGRGAPRRRAGGSWLDAGRVRRDPRTPGAVRLRDHIRQEGDHPPVRRADRCCARDERRDVAQPSGRILPAEQSQDRAAQEELSEVRLRARLNALAPISVLRKRGIVTSATIHEQVEEVKKLLKIADIMDEPQLRVAARRSNCAEPLTATQNAWLACVEQALPPPPVAAYSQTDLVSLAQQASRIVRQPSEFLSLPDAFAQVGVRLVYVEAFPSSRLSGASFLLDDGPVIALSGLRQRLDIVLFTLLHETAHVAQGDLEQSDGPIIDDEDRPHTLGDEDTTDEIAASWMLPRRATFPAEQDQPRMGYSDRCVDGSAPDRHRRSTTEISTPTVAHRFGQGRT